MGDGFYFALKAGAVPVVGLSHEGRAAAQQDGVRGAVGSEAGAAEDEVAERLRHLGLGGYGERVLDQVGVERKPLEAAEECCGFGGLFSVEMPEISGALMDTKIDHVEATEAEILVGYDMSCLMHLAGGMRRRGTSVEVRHIAEILSGGEDL